MSKVAAETHTVTPFVTEGLSNPEGLAFDGSDNLYVANAGNSTVSKVAEGTHTATAFVTSGLFAPAGLAFDTSGNLYLGDILGVNKVAVAAGGDTATRIATTGLDFLYGLAFDASGNLYLSKYYGNTVSKVGAVPGPGGVAVRSSLGTRPMLLGDTSSPVAGLNFSSAELARIQTSASSTLTIGDDSQTGDITFRAAQPAPTAGTTLVVSQAAGGPGRIVLDDEGTDTALNGNGGSVHLEAGMGGILAAHSAAGLFEIVTTGAVVLDTAGTAGTAANPLHVRAATLAARPARGLALVTEVSQLAADSGNGTVSVRNSGNLTLGTVSSLTGVSAAFGVSVSTTGNLLVSANARISEPGSILFQAGGNLTVVTTATIQTTSTGTLTLNAGFGPASSGSVLTVHEASLLARAAFLNGGAGAGVTFGLVPGGNTPLTLDGGGNGGLQLTDLGNSTPRAFTVTASTVAGGGPTLTYAGLAALTVNGGSGSKRFTVLGTPATTTLTLNGGMGINTLVGSNAGNSWSLVGSNAGHLFGTAYPGPVNFSNIQNLTAGSGGDYFSFSDGASIAGTLSGGGADTLDYSLYTTSVVVDLRTGVGIGIGGSLRGIQNVLGGSGTPSGAGVYNLLIGNGGNYLQGGTGRRNLLVAGGRASILIGGDGEDLLIAGSTTDDSDPALTDWLRIAAYWAGSDDYSTRAGNLGSGTGVPLLDATVVAGNGGGNVLRGNGGLALIFSDGLDTISGFDPNSQVVPITP